MTSHNSTTSSISSLKKEDGQVSVAAAEGTPLATSPVLSAEATSPVNKVSALKADLGINEKPKEMAWKYNPLVYFELPWKARNPYLIATIATMGGLLFGFSVSSVSAFISLDAYRGQFGYPDATAQAGITGAIPAGAFFGSLGSGILSNKMGRRASIQISAFWWIIGAIIQACANNMAALIIGRLIAGCGVGLAATQVPMYIAELSPDKIRGRLVGLFQWSVNWGIMIMFYICYGCTFIDGTKSFRIAWAIQVVPGLMLLLGTTVLHESPRWLASQGRWTECINIISYIEHADPEADQVRSQVDSMHREVRLLENSNFSFFQLFNRQNIRRTHVGIFAMIWQQLSGINGMLYFVVNIFIMAGFTGDTTLVASSIQSVIPVVATLPAILWMDKWGRRPTLIIGGLTMAAFLFAQAGLLGKYSIPTGPEGYQGNTQVRITIPSNLKSVSKATIAMSFLFIASFSPSWGAGAWVYVAEIFPTEQRAYGNAVCGAANWLFNFSISMFTPPAFVSITWKTYIIYGVFCLTMSLHVFLMYPETRLRSLEEVEAMWESGVPAWKSTKWQPEVTPTALAQVHTVADIEEKRVLSTEHTEKVEEAVHIE